MGAAARGVLIVHLEDDEDLHERTPPAAAPSWPELHGPMILAVRQHISK
jgi:hypothetical protein